MHKAQQQVREFHEALDIPVGQTPDLRRNDLRAALIAEEAKETIEAMDNGDLVDAIDGLCDLLYVVYGAAIEFGIDLEPYFEEVHRSNMAKVGGPTRADGKKLKPVGWTPPNIAGILRDQLAASPNVDTANLSPSGGNYTSVVGASATAALR